MNQLGIFEGEIDLVWSVLQELIRLASVYLPEKDG
jgi:hypothetical protein